MIAHILIDADLFAASSDTFTGDCHALRNANAKARCPETTRRHNLFDEHPLFLPSRD